MCAVRMDDSKEYGSPQNGEDAFETGSAATSQHHHKAERYQQQERGCLKVLASAEEPIPRPQMLSERGEQRRYSNQPEEQPSHAHTLQSCIEDAMQWASHEGKYQQANSRMLLPQCIGLQRRPECQSCALLCIAQREPRVLR